MIAVRGHSDSLWFTISVWTIIVQLLVRHYVTTARRKKHENNKHKKTRTYRRYSG